MKKRAIVVHSGGMDSSLCLAHAIEKFGAGDVLSMTFQYGQRHSLELERSLQICEDWGVDNIRLSIDCLAQITENSLTRHDIPIETVPDGPPNTLVVGRNGLMARVASIQANDLGASCIYMGVIEVESANSGYRDCSRDYMDRMEEIMRVDLGASDFEIRTPLVRMTKKETMEFGHEMGVLEYLLDKTVTCYEGLPHAGCGTCPACLLRNEGIREFVAEHADFRLPFELPPDVARLGLA